MRKKQKNKKAAATAAAAAAANAKRLKEEQAMSLDEDGAGPSTSKKSKEYYEKMKQVIEITKKYRQLEDHSTDDNVDSDDDVPDAVTMIDSQVGSGLECNSPLGIHKQSRGEKKARRLLAKLDLKPVENVSRVTMRKNKNILLFIEQPEVYKVGDTYLCFGEVRVEDITNTAAAQAADRYRQNAAAADQSEREALAKAQAAAADEVDDPEIDEAAAAELDNRDIDLVQMQATCSRKKAIKALLDNENDVVNAIMALTLAST